MLALGVLLVVAATAGVDSVDVEVEVTSSELPSDEHTVPATQPIGNLSTA